MNSDTSRTYSSFIKYAFLSILELAAVLIGIILIGVNAHIPYKLYEHVTIDGNDKTTLSNAQSLRNGGMFLLFLAFLLSIYSFSYGVKKLKLAKTKQEKLQIQMMMSSVLVFPAIVNLVMCIKNLNIITKSTNYTFCQWWKEQKIPVSPSNWSKLIYVFGVLGFLIQFVYIIFSGLNVFMVHLTSTVATKDPNTGVISYTPGDTVSIYPVFYYDGRIWYSWWYSYFTSLSNWLLFIYLFIFIFFTNAKILRNNTFIMAITVYLIIVGVVHNALLLKAEWAERHTSTYWIFTNALQHMFAPLFSVVFTIGIILSRRYGTSLQSFWLTFGKIYGFGVTYIIYLYIIPFVTDFSTYSFSNINPNSTAQGRDSVGFNIAVFFLIPIFAIIAVGFFYLLNKYAVLGDAFIWFKLPKKERKQHLNIEFVKNYRLNKQQNIIRH